MADKCCDDKHTSCKVHDFDVKSAKTVFANPDGSSPQMFDIIVISAKGPDVGDKAVQPSELHVDMVFPASVIPELIGALAHHLHVVQEAKVIGSGLET